MNEAPASVTLGAVLRAVLPVAFGLVLLATGCDRLLGLSQHDPPVADAPRPTSGLVQQQTAANSTAMSLAATLLAPPTIGNVLVVIGATDRSNLMRPSGGGVSTWSLAAVSLNNSDIEIWYGITDGSSSVVTITCSSPLSGNMRLSLTEWSGLATANVFETGIDASGTSTPGTASPGAITTVDGPDLLILGVSVYGTVSADVMGTGTWTALDPVAADAISQSQWYQLAAEPGSHTGSVTVNGNWDAAVVAFRAK